MQGILKNLLAGVCLLASASTPSICDPISGRSISSNKTLDSASFQAETTAPQASTSRPIELAQMEAPSMSATPSMAQSMAPALTASATAAATTTTLAITPKTVYVHIQQRQQFASAGATSWKCTLGQITNTGLYIAPYTLPASPRVTITATSSKGSVAATVTLVAGVTQTVAPTSVTLTIGAKHQFTSSGATSWAATYGTITSAGLYTAPAIWPASGNDKITVLGTHGSVSANVVITPPKPVVTSVGVGNQIPLGLFSVVVHGTNFSTVSQASMFGLALPTTYVNGALKISGFRSVTGTATLTVFNRTVASSPFTVQVGVPNPKCSPAAARRLLQQAAFGPTPNDAARVQALGIRGWINEQLAMSQASTYAGITAPQNEIQEHFITDAVYQPDQLRQRVAFALSQIFVTSVQKLAVNANMILYQDMLLKDAFVNYRTIMNDVTLSPAMGQYLDMANNAKGDPTAGTLANENYARELMQLFTLGTFLLNSDGTLKYDANQQPIPTYSQFTVTEFARVYTGWTYPQAPGKPAHWMGAISSYGPMVPYPDQHDSGSKQLLNGYVSPAGATPAQDLANALNNIFNHANAGPFVARHLIQHLVKSNPSPAYIGRVAAAFNNNGSGVRGDMKAIITAILMDPEARANDEGGADKATDGHLQEPALFIPAMIRAFGGYMNDQNHYRSDLLNMGQNLFYSPSVFNYFSPDYQVPDTSIYGPEFQIYSPNAAVIRANEVSALFSQFSNTLQMYGTPTTVELAPYVPLASNPSSLVAALDLTLTRGVMPAEMKSTIISAVTAETGGNLRRVQKACYLILTSSYYNVWH